MPSRTANWIHSTPPGVPPPPPSNRSYSPAPSSVYPHSSVSNPDASRYRRMRSQSIASSQPQGSYHPHPQAQSIHSRSSSQYSQNRPPPSRAYTVDSARRGFPTARSGSMSGTRTTGSARGTYVQADKHLPVVARTTSSDGRTSSWVIIPPEGQSVEVVSPQRPSSSAGHYVYSTSPVSSPTRSNSSGSQKNLLRRMFDKVEWGSKSTTGSHHSSSSRRSRRNSTGSGSGSHSASSWTVLSGGRNVTGSGVSVSTVKAGRRTVDIIHV